MHLTSAHVLEFPALLEMLAGYCASQLGKSAMTKLAPSTDVDWISRQHALTSEVRQFLRTGARFEFGGLFDAVDLLHKSQIGGAALEMDELRDVLEIAEIAQAWRHVGLKPPSGVESWPLVEELTQRVADFSALLAYFRTKLLPDGGLADNASPELARLRREIERQRRDIQESLRGYMRRLAEGGAAQDELITIRGERFVVPIKAEHKYRVKGVVHGASSSGQTVFVEPLETIEQNNELIRLIEAEQAEVHRILVQMTQRMGEAAPQIAVALEVLAELELQFAKARYAEDFGCASPNLTERELDFKNARHPLLERNLRARGGSAVPFSLALNGQDLQVIISGPNTGGKTVGLKTAGLLALMGQAGIPMTVESAAMPVFDAVLADIGDYQSIEQNLSTFSAHVTNIDFISKTATSRSLVLLDELGSATDPEEGAALAVSIAEHFRAIGALTIISTHHTALKVYAANNPGTANHPGVLNASVGFDEATLQPTYQLRIGVPGASAGVNIAQRLGMNPEIIAAARSRLGTQTQDISRFLDQLQQQVAAAEDERTYLTRERAEVERERRRLESQGLEEQRKKTRELDQKLEALLRDFEYQARESVAAVQDRASQQKLSKEAERRIAKLRREFKEQFNAGVVAHRTGADVGDPNARPHEVKYVQEGDVVRLKSLGRNGTVLHKIDDSTYEVEVGAMKMRVQKEDIAAVVSASSSREGGPQVKPAAAARTRGIQVQLASGDDNAPSEINVIGQTVDEASAAVEKFVDRAFLAGLPRVRIVHGSGMGILRKALRQQMRDHPHVAEIVEPPQNEGGAGATVLELRG